MTLLWWLIKRLLCCYNAFIFEDRYFLRSFIQELSLRFYFKETTRQGLKPQAMLPPMTMCGLPGKLQEENVIIELPLLLKYMNPRERRTAHSLGDPVSL